MSKYTLTIWSSICALLYLPKGVENLGPDKNLNTDVYRGFIPNFHNLEAINISFSWWMDE